MQAFQPIGIFDSGIGGLAIARVIKDLLPNEAIYYVGDTANLPYGEQTATQLQTYVKDIGSLLLHQRCKLILIACNTATTAASDILQEHVGPHVPVINVIDPVADHIQQQYAEKTIGLIGTSYTIQSGVYTQKFHALQAGIHLKPLATPLLVPMIEQDNFQTRILQDYLAHPQLQAIQALVLGCTHYLLIKSYIAHFYQGRVAIIDGANTIAKFLRAFLTQHQLRNLGNQTQPDCFVATQLTQGFQATTQRYFGQAAHLVSLRSSTEGLKSLMGRVSAETLEYF